MISKPKSAVENVLLVSLPWFATQFIKSRRFTLPLVVYEVRRKETTLWP